MSTPTDARMTAVDRIVQLLKFMRSGSYASSLQPSQEFHCSPPSLRPFPPPCASCLPLPPSWLVWARGPSLRGGGGGLRPLAHTSPEGGKGEGGPRASHRPSPGRERGGGRGPRNRGKSRTLPAGPGDYAPAPPRCGPG